jgi:hypothetical protein
MKSDKKIAYYSLLANKDVTQYLKVGDKGELGLACKYIFELTYKSRSYHLDLNLNFLNKVGYSNPDMLSDKEDLHFKQLYCLDSALKKRNHYTKKLTVDPQLNYYIISHVISNLNNLTSLYLVMIIIPNQSMQHIFDSLPFLDILHLVNVIISLPRSNEPSHILKFPKYLSNLKLNSCRQLNCDIIDAVALRNRYFSEDFKQLTTIDMPHMPLAKLKQITLQDTDVIRIPVYNQLLRNLTQLSRYNTLISCLNNDTLSIISKNSNLTTLAFDFFYYEPPNTITKFIKLPYIKILNFAPILFQQIETVKNIIRCCSNLESLKYYWTPQTHLYEILNIENFQKLKKLAIVNYNEGFEKLSLSTHSLNLEYIEIHKYDPLQVDTFSLINNFPKLERIKIILLDKYVDIYDSIKYYFEHHQGWKIIYHHNSIDLRKI